MSAVNSTRQPVPRKLIVVLSFVVLLVFCGLYGKACILAIAACAIALWQSPAVWFGVGAAVLLWIAQWVIKDAVLAALREHERTR